MSQSDKKICEDVVFIRDLELFISAGFHDHERIRRQKILVDLEMMKSSFDAQNELAPKCWIDYEKVHQAVVAVAQAEHFDLLEHLAKKIIQKIFAVTLVDSVRASLSKPAVLAHTRCVGVSLLRHRDQSI